MKITKFYASGFKLDLVYMLSTSFTISVSPVERGFCCQNDF